MAFLNKEIEIPVWLQELHGKKTTLFALVLTYVSGFCFALIGFLTFINLIDLWKVIVVTFVFFDIGGGVVANFTNSTNLYYEGNNKLKNLFIFLHISQPVLLGLLLGEWMFFLSLGIFSILSCLFIKKINNTETQQIIAAFLSVIGISLLISLPVSQNILYAFGALFILKLIIGFSVERHVHDR